MSVDQWFHEWAAYHANILGIAHDQGLDMVASWERLAILGHWDESECYLATEWLAQHAPAPNHLSGYLPALQARLNIQRAVFPPGEANPTQPDLGECALCNSSGRVTVPDLRFLRAGEWRYSRWGYRPTTAVSCRCPLGQWYAHRVSPDRRWMTLETYEMANPDWRQQIADRDAEQREAARLREDQAPGPLAEAVLQVRAKQAQHPHED